MTRPASKRFTMQDALASAQIAQVNALITAAVNALLDGAPGALDTLKELATAVNNDASFAATVTTALAARALDTAVVHKTGAETVAGVKTFSDPPVVPDASFTIAKVVGLAAAIASAGGTSKALGKISADHRSVWTVGGTITPTAFLSHMTRTRVRSTFAGHQIEIDYTAMQGAGEAVPTAGDNSAVTVLASVEYPAGTFHPAYTKDNLRALSVPVGKGISGTLYVDGVDIPANTDYWVRTKVYASSAGAIVATVPSDGVTEWALRELATPGSDYTLTNTGAPAVNTTTGYSPLNVRMTPYVAQEVCVGLTGDSITSGNADPTTSTNIWAGNGGAGGWAIRALSADGATGRSLPLIPNVQMSMSGDTLANWNTPANRRIRMKTIDAANCNNFFVMLGTNDIGGSTVAALQANLLSFWAFLARRGRVFAATLVPLVTSSSDSYATVAGQVQDSTITSKRAQLNQWLRAGAPIAAGVAVAPGTGGALLAGRYVSGAFTAGDAAHPLYMASDIGSQVEDTLDLNFWKVDGTANKYASNNLHPALAGHQLMAAKAYAEFIPNLLHGRP